MKSFSPAHVRTKQLVFAAVFASICVALTLFAASSTAFAEPTGLTLGAPESDYEGGTIPILRLTFRDSIDTETGEPITGDDNIERMNNSINHVYRATDISFTLEVPSDYDNPEEDLWDGVSGYEGVKDLEVEFMRGRGNSTWRQPKKPYKIKLDKKADLFGMGENKHWVLMANYLDYSLSLDRLVGYIGTQMGKDNPAEGFSFTPRGVPVDLYMNDTYYGSYLLMEEVRIDENRLDIDEVDPNASDPDSLDITGDYLLGTNRKPTAFPYEYFHTDRNTYFSWDSPEYEPNDEGEYTKEQNAQMAYVKAHMNRVEDAIFSKDFTNSQGDYVWDLIDMNTFANMWWVQEFFTNPDAYATPSTYLYKVKDTIDASGKVVPGKLYWEPLWDFDLVWGMMEEEGFNNSDYRWAQILRQDPQYVDLLKERWDKLDSILENVTKEGGILDGYLAEMQQSWDADFAIWERGDPRWKSDTFERAIEELRTHIEARRAWINNNLDKLQTKFYYLTFMDGEEQVYDTLAQNDYPTWFFPDDLPDKGDIKFLGWFTADDEEFDPEKAYNQDLTFYARYTDPPEPEPSPDEKVYYTITYDLGGGTLDGQAGPISVDYEEGSTITLPAPIREGYIFDYWEGSRYEAGASYIVTENHEFKAIWKAKPDPGPTPDPEPTPDPTPDPEPEPSPDPGPTPHPDVEPDIKPTPSPDAGSKTGPSTNTASNPVAKTATPATGDAIPEFTAASLGVVALIALMLVLAARRIYAHVKTLY